MSKNSCDVSGQGFFNPYKIILKRKLIHGFDALNRRDYSQVTKLFAKNVHYWFSGNHALGGERHSRAACEAWFARLLRLLPGHFSIQNIHISGMPWNTTVVVRFQDSIVPLEGEPYINDGLQVIRLSWGKAVDIRTYVDTDKVCRALRHMAEQGITEAAAEPIGG